MANEERSELSERIARAFRDLGPIENTEANRILLEELIRKHLHEALSEGWTKIDLEMPTAEFDAMFRDEDPSPE